MTTIQPFAEQGNYTQVHNVAFDHIMPLLSGSEWKILSLIIRKTKGWQKDEDDIAYSQFRSGTGISSNNTIKKALAKLVSMGIVQQGKPAHKADPYGYRLNKNYSCRVSKNDTPSIKKWNTGVSKSVNTKESIKKDKESAATSPEIQAYENTFGIITKDKSELLYDDIDTFGATSVIKVINEAKSKGIRNYGWVAATLKGRANDKAVNKDNNKLWHEIIYPYAEGRGHKKPYREMEPIEQAAFKFVGGRQIGQGNQYQRDQMYKRFLKEFTHAD